MESLPARAIPPVGGIEPALPWVAQAAMLNRLVALVALGGFVVAASGCTAAEGMYKARDKDPNAGGGSMFRLVDAARTH
jgi:hypothetical protein